jgi:hypothetical protein
LSFGFKLLAKSSSLFLYLVLVYAGLESAMVISAFLFACLPLVFQAISQLKHFDFNFSPPVMLKDLFVWLPLFVFEVVVVLGVWRSLVAGL